MSSKKKAPSKSQKISSKRKTPVYPIDWNPGRPTKYKPEYCMQLMQHLKLGRSFDSFAAEILVNPDTLYEWAKTNRDFSEAKKIGETLSLKYWEDKAENIVDTSPGKKNGTVLIYIMKCRFRKFGYMPGEGSAGEGDGVDFDYVDL